MRRKAVFCWGGGKDSALALNRIRHDPRYEVVSLLTTCDEHARQVATQGVRLELLGRQAQSIGLPLETVFISRTASTEEYQQKRADCRRRFISRIRADAQ